jgi:hypothetical protein
MLRDSNPEHSEIPGVVQTAALSRTLTARSLKAFRVHWIRKQFKCFRSL